jgi:hypothetical protein
MTHRDLPLRNEAEPALFSHRRKSRIDGAVAARENAVAGTSKSKSKFEIIKEITLSLFALTAQAA